MGHFRVCRGHVLKDCYVCVMLDSDMKREDVKATGHNKQSLCNFS